MKQKLLSILALLLMTATGAWADTTVTWTASDMSRIYIDFLDGEAYNNTIKGITVTSSGGGGAGASWEGTDIDLNSGSTTITFTSSVGKIKSIAITAEDIEMSSIPSGWTTDYSTLSWSGEASTTVPLPLSGRTEISGISEIVFTIESTVNVTGITLDKTEASMIVGGETLTLTPTVLPAEATDKSVTWSSSNEAVATVSNDGVVTAVAAGTATITVTTTDGAKTATCAVTVAAPAASTYTVTLKEGTEDATSWTIAPAEATTTGVEAGTEVKATYGGTKKVKSVKAVKKAAAARTAAEATAEDIGKLIGADGNIYDDAAAATAASTTAVAMIAYVGNDAETSTTYNHGLALALGDVSDTKNWCSQTEATCLGTGHQFDSEAGAKGDMAGIDNTDYLIDHAPAGHAHDAASAARGYNSGTHPAGTSAWFLPSAGQWDKMAAAAGSYANLIANAGLQGGWDAAYWSSTEGGADFAWFFDSSQGKLDGYSKDEEFRVRACLAF